MVKNKKMKKSTNLILKILVGIPGSGKSTWATNFVKNNPNWVIISRDSYRKMLRDEYVVEPRIEDLITKMVEGDIIAAFKAKQNVILDNTNLRAKYIHPILDLVSEIADVEYQIFDISIDKAIERDSKRDKSVGEDVIRRMFKDYVTIFETFNFSRISKKGRKKYEAPKFDPKLEDIYIFDIDGTVAHFSDKRGPFDWQKVDTDDLDEVVARQFKLHMDAGHKILVLSGRDESSRDKTEQWLDFYGLKYDKLLMRPANDYRKDSIIKKEIYEREIQGKYNVIAIYDDRDAVVRMWRDLGLKVFQVAPGDF